MLKQLLSWIFPKKPASIKEDVAPVEITPVPDQVVKIPASVKDQDCKGNIEKCFMCGHDYIHPHGAVAGLGKCRDCFFRQLRASLNLPDTGEHHL